jgi:tetratricopeptide (TPR) repeat protein
MEKRNLWISLIAVLLSFAGGFFLANAINRSELNSLRSENERLTTTQADVQKKESDSALSDDEINAKLAEADQNPQNFDYQKQLGLALYKYGSMKQDAELISNSIRLLERADSLRNTDHDVILGLGNAYFDIGYFKKENEGLEKARGYYERALKQNPTDAEVKTDLALTYFLFDPPDDEKAIAGFKEALKIDPKLEKPLEFIIQSLLRANRKVEAAEYLAQLKKTNPNSDAIGGLTSKLSEIPTNQPK